MCYNFFMNPSRKGRALLDALSSWFTPFESKSEDALRTKHVEILASVGEIDGTALSLAALAIAAVSARFASERGRANLQHRAHELVDIYARIEASRALFDELLDELVVAGSSHGASGRAARVATLLEACIALNADLAQESLRSGDLQRVGGVVQWIETGLRGALMPTYEGGLRAGRARI